MTTEDVPEADLLLHDLAHAVMVAMENEVEWWTALSLVVIYEEAGERSLIRYRSLDDRELSTSEVVRRLVAQYRTRFDQGVSGEVGGWELIVDETDGRYRLESLTGQPPQESSTTEVDPESGGGS